MNRKRLTEEAEGDCYITARGIRRLMCEKDLKQRDVARDAGFTEQQMSDMLAGRKRILADYIARIASAMDVTAQDIFDAGGN